MADGPHARAMALALRGTPEQVAANTRRVLFTAADSRPQVAKLVVPVTARRVARSFPAWRSWFWPMHRELVDDSVSEIAPPPPEGQEPGLSLFTGGILEIRDGYRRGAMFAEFGERLADGLYQLALAQAIARTAQRHGERWRAACVLAENGDFGPLESLMVLAFDDPLVQRELAAELEEMAWAFDVGADEAPTVAEDILRSRDRELQQARAKPLAGEPVDNTKK